MPSGATRVFAALILAALGVACRATSLDTDGLEEQLKQGLETQLEISGLSVTCPEDVQLDAGSTFECTASDDQGNAFAIEVTQSDDDGNVTWKLIDASQ